MEENNVNIRSRDNSGTIIGVQNNLNFSHKKIPTILSKIIKGISDISSEVDDIENDDYTPYFPEEKIKYNNNVLIMYNKESEKCIFSNPRIMPNNAIIMGHVGNA